MPLPEGIDVAYVWCLLWFGFETVLAGLITQQTSATHLGDRVSSRTYARLGRLNAYLDRQVDVAWRSDEEIVPDLGALLRLETEVKSAAAVAIKLRTRATSLEVARLLAVIEAGLAVAFAGIAAFTGLRSELNAPGITSFAVGTTVSLALLVRATYLGTRIENGEDFP